MPYRLNESTGYIDYDQVTFQFANFKSSFSPTCKQISTFKNYFCIGLSRYAKVIKGKQKYALRNE